MINKIAFLTLFTLTTWSCQKTDQKALTTANSATVYHVPHDSIKPIKDGLYIIGYTLQDKECSKVDTFLINDNNPFINKALSADKSQPNGHDLQKQGSFSYDISKTSLNEIKSMVSDSIPDDSLATYRFTHADIYCDHQVVNNYLIVNYTLLVHAFKKPGLNKLISLSTKLRVLNEANETVFDISGHDFGIGETLISDNKKYLTVYAAEYLTDEYHYVYQVYDLATKELSKSWTIPDGMSSMLIQSKDNVFMYPFTGKGTPGIVRLLVFDATDGQLYQKEIDGRKNLSNVTIQDGMVNLFEDSGEGNNGNSLKLKLSDFKKID